MERAEHLAKELSIFFWLSAPIGPLHDFPACSLLAVKIFRFASRGRAEGADARRQVKRSRVDAIEPEPTWMEKRASVTARYT